MPLPRPRLGLYRYWAVARDFGKRCRQEGTFNVLEGYRNQAQMQAAAPKLPALPSCPDPRPLEVHFLTGSGFWYQTLFCAYSLALHSRRPVRPFIYDDGTLRAAHLEVFLRFFPLARILSKADLTARQDEHLPASRFPYLRQVKLPYAYPHLAKLTGVHGGSTGWKLVLDSDMLFQREPRFLVDWLDLPTHPLFMWDAISAYGYSAKLMEELTGAAQPENINVGVCGLRSDDIDWDQLEFYCQTLVEKEGHSYYLEQALTAMLVSGKPIERCPAQDYIVYPTADQVKRAEGVLHHYTAGSKTWYFRYGWKATRELAARRVKE